MFLEVLLWRIDMDDNVLRVINYAGLIWKCICTRADDLVCAIHELVFKPHIAHNFCSCHLSVPPSVSNATYVVKTTTPEVV